MESSLMKTWGKHGVQNSANKIDLCISRFKIRQPFFILIHLGVTLIIATDVVLHAFILYFIQEQSVIINDEYL